MRMTHFAALMASLLILEGCQRTGFSSFGAPQNNNLIITQPQPLNPAPVGGVETGQLPDTTSDGAFPQAPGGEAATQQLEELATSSQDVTKEELIGRWTLASGGQSCDVFLSLTKWTGGFRAASRGCTDGLALVSAWNVEGKQVKLADSTGANIASLYKTASEKYDGATTGGQSISMGR